MNNEEPWPVERAASEYSIKELLDICSVDNGWAANEIEKRIKAFSPILWRASLLCSHLSTEKTGWRRAFSRYLISSEPLRCDAANMLPEIGKLLKELEFSRKDYV